MNVMEKSQTLFTLTTCSSVTIGFVASFLIGLLLVLSKRFHGSLSMDLPGGIQKFHTVPTPRVGGIPIVLSLLLVWGKSSLEIREILTPILLAGMPAFLFGITEDLTKKVGVLQRLLATMASGLLAWWITEYSISRLDILGVDYLLKFTFISVLVTSFAVGGIANAINIIDGFNGLSTFTCTVAFVGAAVIAYQVGDTNLSIVCVLLSACVWGLFWVNWPFGKIFLGDGGAYFLGFALAWVSILLIERNNSVSAFSALLICILPITEVIYSMCRRWLYKKNIAEPDRQHLHSLLNSNYIEKKFQKYSTLTKNSIVGLAIGLMNVPPVVLASINYKSTMHCIVNIILMVIFYAYTYEKIKKIKK